MSDSATIGESKPGSQSKAPSRLRWAFPFFAALLPIILLSVYSYRVASESVRSVIQAEQISSTSGLSQLMTQDITRTVTLQHPWHQ